MTLLPTRGPRPLLPGGRARSGRRGPADRELRAAADEVRRSAKQLRSALGSRSSVAPLARANVELREAAHRLRDAGAAVRSADGRLELGDLVETLRADLELASGAAADAAAVGLRALGPMPEHAREALRAAPARLRAGMDRMELDPARAAEAAGGLVGALGPAGRLVARRSGRRRRLFLLGRLFGFGRVALLGIALSLAVPLVRMLLRREGWLGPDGSWRGPGRRLVGVMTSGTGRPHDPAAGAADALGESDVAAASDLLRSESEGYGTGIAAPTVSAASAAGTTTSEAATKPGARAGAHLSTVTTPDATAAERSERS